MSAPRLEPANQKWWPPPFVRRTAATRARYKKQHRCEECGAGLYERAPKRFVLQAHHPSCPALKRIVAIENSGVCTQCGARKKRRLEWDARMHAAVKTEWCPNGHSHSATWIWPEHLTQAERDELGLVKAKKRKGWRFAPPADGGA